MSLRLPFALLIGCAALGSPLQAQAPKFEPSVQRFIDAEQALNADAQKRILAVRSHDTIWCGHKDRNGVLWFGTNDGLYRYEGDSITHLTMDDGLSSNQVTSIIDHPEGGLWLGTDYGLCHFDGKAFTHVPLPWNDLSGGWIEQKYPIANPHGVNSMVHDRNGDLWIATRGAGAYRYDGKTFTQYLSDHGQKMEDGQHHNWVPSTTLDQAGNIWFTSMSRGGVSKFDGKAFTHFGTKDGLSGDSLRASFQDRNGTLWFGSNGSRGGTLDSFDGETFTHHGQDADHSHPRTHSIFEDRNGVLWFGCFMDGICTYDGESFKPFAAKPGMDFTKNTFFLEDAAGNLWFGGSGNQVIRYDGNEAIAVPLKASS